jgi:hypothetical protein
VEGMSQRQNNRSWPMNEQVNRRAFLAGLTAIGAGMAGRSILATASDESTASRLRLENEQVCLWFDKGSGVLKGIENKLTEERMEVIGDEFQVDAQEFRLSNQNCQLKLLQQTSATTVEASYGAEDRTIAVAYRLGDHDHFFEKHLVVTSPTAFHLKNLILSRLTFSGIELEWVKYPYLKCLTFFGRSKNGGIFLGVELPYDNSSLDQEGFVSLGYAPSMKAKANEPVVCEPIYCGVCKRQRGDAEVRKLTAREALLTEHFYSSLLSDSERGHLPLHSEAEAMVAMISTILGPPRKRLLPNLNGWESQMVPQPYRNLGEAEQDMASLDFGVGCGIDVFGTAIPWAADFPRLAKLREGDHLQFSDLTLRVAQHASSIGMRWQIWHSLNNTDPWSPQGPNRKSTDLIPPGLPYRPDRPEWRANPLDVSDVFGPETTEQGNCFANEPFFEWLYRVIVEALDTGHFGGWGIDGDFLGGPGYAKPANCSSSEHDHLPGDSNYISIRNLNRLALRIREKYPDLVMSYARPPMDLGVWSLRGVDSVFTLEEYAEPIGLPGIASQPPNIFFGDKIRTWSRIRVERHFFPKYLDAAQLFSIPKSHHGGTAWQSEGIDYIMLSALASSPNHIYYLPTRNGIPDADKQKIKSWLDWGREHIEYLMMRKDLKDWPAAGKVDGFAHVIVDHGFVFLFNPNSTRQKGNFVLDDSIGLAEGGQFRITSLHPSHNVRDGLRYGQQVNWEVPPQTAVLLEIKRMDGKQTEHL